MRPNLPPPNDRPIENLLINFFMKSKVEWHADANGMLCGARIHDAILLGIAFSEAGDLLVSAQRVDKTKVEIEAAGIQQLNIVELWESAINSEIFVWKLNSVPTYASDLAWKGLFRNRVVEGDEVSAAAALANKSPDALLIELSCSYGASIFAVCTQLAVCEIN
jgi:hypothetical protein